MRAPRLLFVASLVACGPSEVVLRSLDDAALDVVDDANDAAEADAETTPIDACIPGTPCDLPLGAPCFKDVECAPEAVCESNVCTACSADVSGCGTKCTPPSVPSAGDRNGCAVCTCTIPPECSIAADCKLGERCLGGKCVACAAVDDGCTSPCPPGQSRFAIKRNGCAVCECARTDDCKSDGDCSATTPTCYAGADCDDGCDGAPACCHGNVCGATGCKPLYAAPCSFGGCASGLSCQSTCADVACTCDPSSGAWSCSACGADACTNTP